MIENASIYYGKQLYNWSHSNTKAFPTILKCVGIEPTKEFRKECIPMSEYKLTQLVLKRLKKQRSTLNAILTGKNKKLDTQVLLLFGISKDLSTVQDRFVYKAILEAMQCRQIKAIKYNKILATFLTEKINEFKNVVSSVYVYEDGLDIFFYNLLVLTTITKGASNKLTDCILSHFAEVHTEETEQGLRRAIALSMAAESIWKKDLKSYIALLMKYMSIVTYLSGIDEFRC